MVVLHNTHVFILYEAQLGVTKGFPADLFLADRERVDLLITSSWFFELFMDLELEPSSEEKKTIVECILASTTQNLCI